MPYARDILSCGASNGGAPHTIPFSRPHQALPDSEGPNPGYKALTKLTVQQRYKQLHLDTEHFNLKSSRTSSQNDLAEKNPKSLYLTLPLHLQSLVGDGQTERCHRYGKRNRSAHCCEDAGAWFYAT